MKSIVGLVNLLPPPVPCASAIVIRPPRPVRANYQWNITTSLYEALTGV